MPATTSIATDEGNLASLFQNLNLISSQAAGGQRIGGGSGGGSEVTQGSMDANPLIQLNPYISKNVSSFHGGGLFGSLGNPFNQSGSTGNVLGGIGNTLGGGLNPYGNTISSPIGGVGNTLGGFFGGSGGGTGGIPTGGINTPSIGNPLGGIFGGSGGTTTPTEPATTITNPAFGSIGNPITGTPTVTTTGGSPTVGGGFMNPLTSIGGAITNTTGGGAGINTGGNVFQGMINPVTTTTGNVASNSGLGQGSNNPFRGAFSFFNEGGKTGLSRQTLLANKPGQYEQEANQMIALNQIGNVFKGLTQGQNVMPMAKKGMKMRKRYTQGGRF